MRYVVRILFAVSESTCRYGRMFFIQASVKMLNTFPKVGYASFFIVPAISLKFNESAIVFNSFEW